MANGKRIETGGIMRDRILIGASVSILISIPWIFFSYLGYQITQLPVIPFELFEALVFISPGALITSLLELMIQTLHNLNLGPTSAVGKTVEMMMAFLLGLTCLILLGVLYAITLDLVKIFWAIKGLLMGITLSLLLIPFINLLELILLPDFPKALWLFSINIIWGISLSWGIDRSISALNLDKSRGRNRVLTTLGIASLSVSIMALGLDRVLKRGSFGKPTENSSNIKLHEQPSPTSEPLTSGVNVAQGTRPEITPIDDFYRVDINLLPPGQEDYSSINDEFTKRLLAQGGETDLPADSYVLIIDGLVDSPLALDLAAIKSYPHFEQYATLSCVSNPIGGDLIGTTLFQGVRLKDLLSQVGIKSGVEKLKITGVDGYSESLPISVANDPTTLLCYSMGNQPLTQNHGAPIRLYTSGKYGMKSLKWIIKIEAIDHEYLGYWQQQGWSDDADVKTTSVIDTILPDQDGFSKLGGIAYAGARGIMSVELKVNDKEWIPAEVNRHLSPITWVLWVAELEIPPEESTVTVRAFDGDGNMQTEESSAPHPDGASGYHSITIKQNV